MNIDQMIQHAGNLDEAQQARLNRFLTKEGLAKYLGREEQVTVKAANGEVQAYVQSVSKDRAVLLLELPKKETVPEKEDSVEVEPEEIDEQRTAPQSTVP